ncbi:MAG: CCA tRNA nucleotidyltransferase [Bryobacterales bacterium]|nr:CCA tRNA nucleotidyltransferase [Bryobacterales bacterium]
MFKLESHLSAAQNRVVKEVQAAAARANVNLFLTGGAVRDMLGGFPIRDLDFTVEGNALKLARALAEKGIAKVTGEDEQRKSAEMVFHGGVAAEIAMARRERYSKPGATPSVSPGTIHEDLRGRDFTINAIALSLNPASLGLLLDPTNGLADLERKEIRAVHSRALYDDPSRMLRLIRFRVRFELTLDERTAQQYENARLDELEKLIPPRQVFKELTEIANEASPGDVFEALAAEKLLPLFLPPSACQKAGRGVFARLQKARQLLPLGIEVPVNHFPLFFFLLTEKLTPSEKSAFMRLTAIRKPELDRVAKLQADSRKLERELRSSRITKPSHVYKTLIGAPGEQLLYLYLTSAHRQVHDRIRNFLQKYLPAAEEITERQVTATGVEAGTAKFKKVLEEMILARVDGRTKKPPPPDVEEAAPPARNVMAAGHSRGQ